jgi:hypothetical protein
MIGGAITVIILIGAYFAFKVINSKKIEQVERARKAKRIDELEIQEQEMNPKCYNTNAKIMIDSVEMQYNPENDFAVFGVGGELADPQQDKLNNADNLSLPTNP